LQFQIKLKSTFGTFDGPDRSADEGGFKSDGWGWNVSLLHAVGLFASPQFERVRKQAEDSIRGLNRAKHVEAVSREAEEKAEERSRARCGQLTSGRINTGADGNTQDLGEGSKPYENHVGEDEAEEPAEEEEEEER
jgi:hypothetical protein